MAWLQYRLETNAAAAPQCEDALLELGAAAVTLEDNADQPLFEQSQKEHQLWQQTRVSGLFPADTDTAALWQALPDDLRVQCHARAEILEDKDWEREWMQHYQPLQYAPNLWICPSWLEPPQPDAINIMLDPGLAFGTGTHPTTAMCLRLLAALDLNDKQVTDFGCGSGVLAIGALLLGARAALGVDTDPQALLATRNNAQRNQIESKQLRAILPADLNGAEQADIVVANILAGPLCDLAATLCDQLRPGGILILSGILQEQVPSLQSSYPLPLKIAAQEDGWVALQGERSD
jgi:ribosomal protein L11 methyltransferase